MRKILAILCFLDICSPTKESYFNPWDVVITASMINPSHSNPLDVTVSDRSDSDSDASPQSPSIKTATPANSNTLDVTVSDRSDCEINVSPQSPSVKTATPANFNALDVTVSDISDSDSDASCDTINTEARILQTPKQHYIDIIEIEDTNNITLPRQTHQYDAIIEIDSDKSTEAGDMTPDQNTEIDSSENSSNASDVTLHPLLPNKKYNLKQFGKENAVFNKQNKKEQPLSIIKTELPSLAHTYPLGTLFVHPHFPEPDNLNTIRGQLDHRSYIAIKKRSVETLTPTDVEVTLNSNKSKFSLDLLISKEGLIAIDHKYKQAYEVKSHLKHGHILLEILKNKSYKHACELQTLIDNLEKNRKTIITKAPLNYYINYFNKPKRTLNS